MTSDDKGAERDLAEVSRILDQVFDFDPWKPSSGTFDAGNAVPLRVEILVILFIAITSFAGVLYILRTRPLAPTPPAPAARSTGLPRALADLPDTLLALGVGVGAFVWLRRHTDPARVDYDPAAALLLAQDCLKLSICHLTSIDSGIPGFTNGAIWIHLLTAIGLFRGTTVAVQGAVLGLMATGVATIFLGSWRWLRPALALPAALLAVAALGRGGDLSASYLVDATAVVFPAAACAVLLLIFVSSGRSAALIIAAVFASHAVCTHVAAVVLLPALLITATLSSRRPLLDGFLTIAALYLTTLITSPAALWESGSHLGTTGRQEAACLAGVSLAGGLLLNRQYRRLGAPARAALLAALLLGPFIAGSAWLSYLGRPPTSRYQPAVLAPLSMAAAALLVLSFQALLGRKSPRARWGQLGALGIGVWALVAAPRAAGRPEWTFEDGRLVAAQLEHEGWCYSRLFSRVQGLQCTSIAYATMPYACHASTEAVPSPDLRRQVRIWLTNRSQLPLLPPDTEVVSTGPDRVAIVAGVTSWLDKAATEFCISHPGPSSSEGTKQCTAAATADAVPFLYSHRLAQGFRDANYSPPYTMSFSFPVYPSAGEQRRFYFADEAHSFGIPGDHPPPPGGQAERCGWQVTQVVGLEADRPLPANPVRLTSKQGAPGRMVIEHTVGGDCPGGFPGRQIPCHLETLPNDPPWMEE